MSYQKTLVGLLEDSQDFQLLMDDAVEVFEAPIWSKYLNDKFTKSLDWRAVLGVMENSPAASVIDFSGKKPLAVRPTMSKINGELATFGNKYQMNKREIRDFLDLQASVGTLGIDATTLIDFLMPDLKRATVGPHKAIDRLLLETMSTGLTSLTNVNNPKGVVWNAALNWGIDKEFVTTVWSNTAAKPLTEIKKKMRQWLAKGVGFKIMKMSTPTYDNMVATTEFINAFKMQMGSATEINNAFLQVDTVSRFLVSIGLPAIELMDDPISVEKKDGTYETILPFADNRVTFTVDNNFGDMIRTYANEEQLPEPGKSYALANSVHIAKYRKDGSEFTESEFNAFPVINIANSMMILATDETSAW
jgi:hypothetical protein